MVLARIAHLSGVDFTETKRDSYFSIFVWQLLLKKLGGGSHFKTRQRPRWLKQRSSSWSCRSRALSRSPEAFRSWCDQGD